MRDKIISSAMESWMKGDKDELRDCLPALKELYEEYSEYEQDYRSGYDTYGYDVFNDIVMEYISDRWRNAFRIKWLIDGIEDGHL